MAILSRYLFKELLIPFVLSVAVLLFLLVTQQAVRLVDLLVNRGVEAGILVKIFTALLPAFFVVTLPVAVLMATIGAFNRLAADREIVALRASGVRMIRLVVPAAVFAAVMCLVAYSLSLVGEPWAGKSFRSLTGELLKRQATVALTEGAFNELVNGMTLYIEKIPSGNQLDGVLIVDQRAPGPPALILAKQGSFLASPNGSALGLRLSQGSIHRSLSAPDDAEDRYQLIQFDTYELKLDVERLQGALPATDGRSSLAELRHRAADEVRAAGRVQPDTERALFSLYKDRAFPLATFWLGVLGVPLGIATRRAGRVGGFGFGILAVGVYYLLLIAADSFAARTWLSAPVAAWFPNAVLAMVTISLLITMDRVRRRSPRR
ncbi:MAG: LptF/LptG family permease [Nitrospirae bacterium]|nr:LptF/LptG family permease [Nitrospirota bacterium]